MKWITRSHVHIDRVACPWLIKRFIDKDAKLLFVDRDKVVETAEKENAIPFDIPGVELGHHGDNCSFIAFLKKYNLQDPALVKIGELVNAADTDRADSHPFAVCLDAFSRGCSRLYPDDQENIQHQFELYDGLYSFYQI